MKRDPYTAFISLKLCGSLSSFPEFDIMYIPGTTLSVLTVLFPYLFHDIVCLELGLLMEVWKEYSMYSPSLN